MLSSLSEVQKVKREYEESDRKLGHKVLHIYRPRKHTPQRFGSRSVQPAGKYGTTGVDALDCGVCSLPLKPPIFQCEVGHMVCSSCRDKLAAAGACHLCCAPTRGYRRCHGMEDLVESIRVQCPNAAHGCTARPAYYASHDHLKVCPHGPCYCPAEDCGFAGSTAAVRGHFEVEHRWPCIANVEAFYERWISLQDGFNVVDVFDDEDNKYLFLLMVSRERLGRVISVVWVRPRSPVDDSRFYLRLGMWQQRDGDDSHQDSVLKVACTDLSMGLPDPNDIIHAFVLNRVQSDDGDATIDVEICFRIEWPVSDGWAGLGFR